MSKLPIPSLLAQCSLDAIIDFIENRKIEVESNRELAGEIFLVLHLVIIMSAGWT